MTEELDPEVLADLQLRARTARERGDGDPTTRAWRPPAIAAQWPCRRCGVAMVGVDQGTVDALAMNNRLLAKRGERAIPPSSVVFCDACAPIARAERSARIDAETRETAALLRELRTLVDNDLRERSIADRLRELGHPDVAGVLRDARIARAAKRTTPTRRHSL